MQACLAGVGRFGILARMVGKRSPQQASAQFFWQVPKMKHLLVTVLKDVLGKLVSEELRLPSQMLRQAGVPAAAKLMEAAT